MQGRYSWDFQPALPVISSSIVIVDMRYHIYILEELKLIGVDGVIHWERMQFHLRWLFLEGFASRLIPAEHPVLIAIPDEVYNY